MKTDNINSQDCNKKTHFLSLGNEEDLKMLEDIFKKHEKVEVKLFAFQEFLSSETNEKIKDIFSVDQEITFSCLEELLHRSEKYKFNIKIDHGDHIFDKNDVGIGVSLFI